MNKLFTQAKIGPLTLRNRSIRAAAFEGMCPDGIPSDSLINYHHSLAKGGIAMTTVAYMSITNGGRSFSHQGWIRPEIVPHLKKLTDKVHSEGALASIQLGHCGNMSDNKVSGERAIAPSSKFTLFGLTLPRKMSKEDIKQMIKAFGNAVKLSREAGFDAVEIHAGHGYLISQFLCPYTNRRKDEYGGSLENRYRFLHEVMKKVKRQAGKEMAVLVKMNLRDGFKGGMDLNESVKIAEMLESDGADALILSGGFVSKCPMYVMRGETPHKELIKYQTKWLLKLGLIFFSRFFVKDYPFEEAYFLKDALKIREAVGLPLIYIGGLLSLDTIEKVLDKGFDFIALARALFYEPDFINKLKSGEAKKSECEPCNKCVATMYSDEAVCLLKEERGK